jgi:hypothetical protein
MVSPAALLQQPSDLDRTEILHYPGGRKEYRLPDAGRAAAEAAQWAEFYKTQAVEKEHTDAITARVREVLALGPPTGMGSALVRHLQWLVSAERKASAAEGRASEAEAIAGRHEDAKAAYANITAEVYESASAWARYAVGRDDDDDDLRPLPDLRQTALRELETEIAATAPIHGVLPLARFESEVATAVVEALRLVLLQRQCEALRADEGQRLVEQARALVADLGALFGQMRSLDQTADLDSEISITLRNLGVAAPRRLLPVNAGRVELPSVAGEPTGFKIEANEAALARFAERLARIRRD